MVFGNCGVLPEINNTKAYVEMTGIDPETSQDICEVCASDILNIFYTNNMIF